jgi:hypothetical protein
MSRDWVARYVVVGGFSPRRGATIGRSHTRSNATKNLSSGAKPPEGIHIIKNDFDFFI